MISIQNIKIDVTAEKDGQRLYKKTFRNRLVNNVLDYTTYAILPEDIAKATFTQFPDLNRWSYMEVCYINFTNTNSLDDTSTTLLYDEFAAAGSSDSVDGNKRVMRKTFKFTPDDLSSVPSGTSLKELGFGFAGPGTVVGAEVANYLQAYLDVSAFEVKKEDDVTYYIDRYDEVSTTEISLTDNYEFLPEQAGQTYVLDKIIMAEDLNGQNCQKEYNIDDLTFTNDGVGKASITGFDNFYIETNVLYPATDLYPSATLYPTQCYEKIKSVVFEYVDKNDATDTIQTYINLEDLDATYNDTAMSITLNTERRDY